MARNGLVTKLPTRELLNYLDYLDNRYSELEDLHRDWSRVPDGDKVEFAEEWGMVKVMLARLEQSVRRSGVPEAYRERYARLQERIARDEPLVAGLWERP